MWKQTNKQTRYNFGFGDYNKRWRQLHWFVRILVVEQKQYNRMVVTSLLSVSAAGSQCLTCRCLQWRPPCHDMRVRLTSSCTLHSLTAQNDCGDTYMPVHHVGQKELVKGTLKESVQLPTELNLMLQATLATINVAPLAIQRFHLWKTSGKCSSVKDFPL